MVAHAVEGLAEGRRQGPQDTPVPAQPLLLHAYVHPSLPHIDSPTLTVTISPPSAVPTHAHTSPVPTQPLLLHA